MSLILNLETSTKNCSVNIAKNGISLVNVEECFDKHLHSEKLHTFIKYAIKISGIDLKNLSSICINRGPGSYTSLRIGSSTAKGLCISLGIPLLSIDSLTLMIQKINNIKSGFLIPMIHAKYNSFYTCLFNESKEKLSAISIKEIDKNFFIENTIENKKVYILGNLNLLETKFFFAKKNFVFVSKRYLSAIDMSNISYIRFREKKFHNVENFSPFYL
ncbi:tRNA (adenosine(37)-N6)-threonylcarbamoyltransferase complex dimerization subunit type 1 TsaB [Blattabacterium cuenoti]|uniref:tRNA (adenosine(37)-N6)-threonylcarbamoyltransferase complex dimerization subunit type 1 TsaB n=1 Tax=Blattabacterium cuenoti TaxID=1653831 RepID=UPI00163CF044|nr:tRNA (adenosine(37)-N6)-threonylcarbamoyltransferase complex dimerization subunit type 1 TsaB [Blattabacterium cuenoti]